MSVYATHTEPDSIPTRVIYRHLYVDFVFLIFITAYSDPLALYVVLYVKERQPNERSGHTQLGLEFFIHLVFRRRAMCSDRIRNHLHEKRHADNRRRRLMYGYWY